MNVILCGLPMCGKTTIGKMLSKRLNWNFIDTDLLIENWYAIHTTKYLSCRQIFIHEGEAFFRKIEKQHILSLKASVKNIISLGGGALCDQENTQHLQSIGEVYYLKTPVNILWYRVQSRGIPAYLDQNQPEVSFYEMARKRASFYEKAAHFIIETNHLSEQDIINTLLNRRENMHG